MQLCGVYNGEIVLGEWQTGPTSIDNEEAWSERLDKPVEPPLVIRENKVYQT